MFVPPLESISDDTERAAIHGRFDTLISEHRELQTPSKLETAVERFDIAQKDLDDVLRELVPQTEPKAEYTHEALTAASDTMRQLVDAIREDDSLGEGAALQVLAAAYHQGSESHYEFVRSVCGDALRYGDPEVQDTLEILQALHDELGVRSPAFTDQFLALYEESLATYTSALLTHLRTRSAPAESVEAKTATTENPGLIGDLIQKTEVVNEAAEKKDIDHIRISAIEALQAAYRKYCKEHDPIDFDDEYVYAELMGKMQDAIDTYEESCGLQWGDRVLVSGDSYFTFVNEITELDPGEQMRGEYCGLIVTPIYDPSATEQAKTIVIEVGLSMIVASPAIIDELGNVINSLPDMQNGAHLPLQGAPDIHLWRANER